MFWIDNAISHDSGNREFYIYGYPQVYSNLTEVCAAVNEIVGDSYDTSWIYTDDYGWFERTFRRVQDKQPGYESLVPFDCYEYIIMDSVVSGTIWILACAAAVYAAFAKSFRFIIVVSYPLVIATHREQ